MPDDTFTDDRPENSTLGTEDPTQYREAKPAGSASFADERDDAPDGGEQSRLTPDGDDRQRTHDGEKATDDPEWSTP